MSNMYATPPDITDPRHGNRDPYTISLDLKNPKARAAELLGDRRKGMKHVARNAGAGKELK